MANISPSLENKLDKVVDIPGGARSLSSSNSFAGLDGVINFVDSLFGGSRMTNQTNMTMNRENIAFQREENEITREREDNAVQRAAADMTAAGLSKTLAAGNPASAQALDAPNNSFAMEKDLAGFNAIKFLKEMHYEEEANKRANSLNDAQVDLVNAQAAAQNFSNSVQEKTWQNEQDYKTAMIDQAKSVVALNNANAAIYKITGDTLQEKIDSDIALTVANTVESYSRTELNNVNRNKADREISKISWEIYNEYLNSGYIKAKTDTEKQQLQIAIRSATKAYYETEILKHNLNYSQSNGLPVGVVPSGLVGSIVPAAQSIGNQAYRNILKPTFTFVKDFATRFYNGFTSLFE